MTVMGWAILGAILLFGLQLFAVALVQTFDEDPPRPPPPQDPVVHCRRIPRDEEA